jgi:hypothetical protein
MIGLLGALGDTVEEPYKEELHQQFYLVGE